MFLNYNSMVATLYRKISSKFQRLKATACGCKLRLVNKTDPMIKQEGGAIWSIGQLTTGTMRKEFYLLRYGVIRNARIIGFL